MSTNYLDNPEQLEILYRKDKTQFQHIFSELEHAQPGSPLVSFWQSRLKFDQQPVISFAKNDLYHIAATVVLMGTLATFPFWSGKTEEEASIFFLRNIGFLALTSLMAYFFRTRQHPQKLMWMVTAVVALLGLYINLLPGNAVDPSDTLILAGVHLPLILWGITGYIFNSSNRFEYLRFNGDLLVAAGILFLSWMLMSGVTMGLFELIGFRLEQYYPRYVIIPGLTAIPILAAITVLRNTGFVNQVSPWIARIFSPLALVMLSLFLIFFLRSGRDPFTDREFLLVFNLILVAVLALILFSLSAAEQRWLNKVLFALSLVTILVNLTALSAIVYRLADYGLTPNRLAILGANVLCLIHLFIVGNKLRLLLSGKVSREHVLTSIGHYLPVYLVWSAVVVILFPLLFGFK